VYGFVQKLVAEFIGTFAFVLIAIAAICADQYLRAANQTGLGAIGIALAGGLAIAPITTALVHISGAHFNPAVTVGLWVTRRLGTVQSVLYCAAQLVGALAAAYSVKWILPENAWGPAELGTPFLSPDLTRLHAMALEAALTFLLVVIFFATTIDARTSSGGAAGIAIGLAYVIGTLVAYTFTGGAMNPARVFGPALASRHWANHAVYWVGPLLGGVVGGFLYDRIFLRRQPPI
jgi:MIP family channel proteins